MILVTSTKPIKTKNDYIMQYLSLRSAALSDARLVVNYSEDLGASEISDETHTKNVPPEYSKNKELPSIKAIFDTAKRLSNLPDEALVYINADILVSKNFSHINTYLNLRFPDGWLAVARRRELDLAVNTKLSDVVVTDLANDIKTPLNGRHTAIDFFAYPSKLHSRLSVPGKFLVGRPGWDNWLLAKARKGNIPVVDVTSIYSIRHITHPFTHKKGAYSFLIYLYKSYGLSSFCDLRDCTHSLMSSNGKLKANLNTYGYTRGSLLGRYLIGIRRLIFAFLFRR